MKSFEPKLWVAPQPVLIIGTYNEDTGSWGNAGRICFFQSRVPRNFGKIAYREGRGGSLWYRINCNDYVENIVKNHDSTQGKYQNISRVRATIPPAYLKDFDLGLKL